MPGALKALVDRLKAPTPALFAVGTMLASRARRCFLRQRHGATQWPPRSTPSVAGVVADLEAGRPVHPARLVSRPALVVTGALRASIRFTVAEGRVRLFAHAPYARLHERGGVTRQLVTRATSKGLVSFLRAHPELRPKLGFIFAWAKRGRVLTTRVPPRPFLAPTATDMKDASAIVRRFVRSGRT